MNLFAAHPKPPDSTPETVALTTATFKSSPVIVPVLRKLVVRDENPPPTNPPAMTPPSPPVSPPGTATAPATPPEANPIPNPAHLLRPAGGDIAPAIPTT